MKEEGEVEDKKEGIISPLCRIGRQEKIQEADDKQAGDRWHVSS